MFDRKWLEEHALFGCQHIHCATEISYHVDMLALYGGKPICEECYGESNGDKLWSDLPAFDPFAFMDEIAAPQKVGGGCAGVTAG